MHFRFLLIYLIAACFISPDAAHVLGQTTTSQGIRKTLSPRVVLPGERFSNHFQQLLQVVGGPYELNGKKVAPGQSDESIRQDAEFILQLCSSDDPHLKRLALATSGLYALRAKITKDAASQNANLQQAVERAVKNGDLDMDEELKNLDQGGLLTKSLGDKAGMIGRVLEKLLITDEFKLHREVQSQRLAFGALTATTRRRAEILAGEATLDARSAALTFDVTIEHEVGKDAYLRIVNRARKPLHHVLISTRSTADPALVRRTAALQGLGGLLLDGLGVLPKETTAEMPTLVELWVAIQLLDFGAVVYIPELPAASTAKVILCGEERLRLTKEARVSIWSDELAVTDLAPRNFQQTMDELRAPPKPQSLLQFKPFPSPIVEPPKPPKPNTRAEAMEQVRKQKERDRLAAHSLVLARGAIARKDERWAVIYLEQTIRIAPESPAAKTARLLLRKYNKDE